MYPIVLSLHIIFGVISMIFCTAALYVVATNSHKKYDFYKKSIWGLTLMEVISGVAVVFLGPSSLLSFCVSLSFYLLMIFGVQFLLYYKSRKKVASVRA